MTPHSSAHVKGLALPVGTAGTCMLLWMCISELWPNSGNNSLSSRDEPPDLPGVVLSLIEEQCLSYLVLLIHTSLTIIIVQILTLILWHLVASIVILQY